MSEPERCNVLVMTIGGAPGVVTETVFALLDRKPPWVPHNIHLVTTSFGARDWRDPESRANCELKALFAHFGLPFVAPGIVVPRDQENNEIADIRTEEENVAFANALTWCVMKIKERKNVHLHVSLAGGRKTMSSYAQSAMQYFAEEADELTHTLVEPQSLEYHQHFFWPWQVQQEIDVGRNGAPCIVRADTARIALVPSPFVRLRPHIQRIPFAKDNFDHWTLTERMQERLNAYAPMVTLEVAACTVRVDRTSIQFGEQEFALYWLLAEAIKQGWRGVGPDGEGDNHKGWFLIADFTNRESRAFKTFFSCYRDCFAGVPDATYENFKETVERSLRSGTAEGLDYVANRFKALRNKVKGKFDCNVTSMAVRRAVTPVSLKAVPKGRKYGLRLDPEEIEIVGRENGRNGSG